jgi:hypothetical protein
VPYKDKNQQRAAQRAWAQKNSETMKEYRNKKRNKARRFIEEYKINNSVCQDCKISYPPHMLDFDHVRGTKVDGIANMIKGANIDLIIEEINKCEIVCANCHRHRTWIRRGTIV